jgi:hypothetical protein
MPADHNMLPGQTFGLMQKRWNALSAGDKSFWKPSLARSGRIREFLKSVGAY